MSVTTKIVSPGLVRDSAPEVGSQVNGLRRAENVVCRSPGVVETRPSFELLVEDDATTRRVRALREFNGKCLSVQEDSVSHAWTIRDETLTAYSLPIDGMAEPPDYYASESQFAQARKNLYVAGKYGQAVLESEVAGVGRYAGVDVMALTDYRYFPGNFSIADNPTEHSWAYEFVFVRKDANGYTRRSPSSYRVVCVARVDQPNPDSTGVYASGSRFFIPTTGVSALRAGDQVEFYRTRTVEGLSPGSAAFLAFTYTLTDDDITAKYFAPPTDTVLPDNLGAALYTNIDQDGALGAKYMPPRAQTLALWARAMWYGRTVSKNRATIEIQRLHRAGVMRYATEATYTAASNVVTMADTTGLEAGMSWTDQYRYGSTVDGAFVPANSYIASVDSPTQITIFSSGAFGSGTAVSGVMDTGAWAGVPGSMQQGLIGEQLGTAVYTAGSPNVTLVLATTDGLTEGMYWTDSASGPNTLGSHVLSHTTIAEIFDSTHFAMSTNATNSGSAVSYVGDIIRIDDRDYYCWPQEYNVDGLALVPPWASTMAYCLPLIDARGDELCYQVLVDYLVMWVNWHRLFGDSGAPGSSVAAIPAGDFTLAARSFSQNGDGHIPLLLEPQSHSVLLEEQGVGGDPWTVSSTNAGAFAALPPGVLNSENDDRPNRLHWSQPDEPEAVTLLSFVDIGEQTAPIMRVVALRNALLVFKSDGLWRVTGSGPSAWSVELLDPTLQLLRAEAVTVSNNKAYAWCVGGFYECDETGSRSLSAEKLDVELRVAAGYVTSSAFSRGALVIAVEQRNLVLFGVPGAVSSDQTATVFAYDQTTQGWSEWPLAWEHACESASLDRCYYSRPPEAAKADANAIDVEIRRMASEYRGYDRTYDLGGGTGIDNDTVTVPLASLGTWRPVVGDWISAVSGSTRIYRRILEATFDAGSWTLVLEDEIADGDSLLITDADVFFVTEAGVFFFISDLSAWQAHEAATIALEWHPTAPAGLPVGAIARELQMQLDLREAPDPAEELSIPRYIVGGSSERSTTLYTVESAMARTATVQPLRVGVSRQLARAATVAPYFETSDIYAIRLVGASIVFEGVSEKTRR